MAAPGRLDHLEVVVRAQRLLDDHPPAGRHRRRGGVDDEEHAHDGAGYRSCRATPSGDWPAEIERLPGLSAPGRVAGAGRAREACRVPRRGLLGPPGARLRRPRGTRARARARARGPRCEPHRPGLHRRPVGRLAVRGDAPGRLREPADVGRARRRAPAHRRVRRGRGAVRPAGQQADARGARPVPAVLRARARAARPGARDRRRSARSPTRRCGRCCGPTAWRCRAPGRSSGTAWRWRRPGRRSSAASTRASRTRSPASSPSRCSTRCSRAARESVHQRDELDGAVDHRDPPEHARDRDPQGAIRRPDREVRTHLGARDRRSPISGTAKSQSMLPSSWWAMVPGTQIIPTHTSDVAIARLSGRPTQSVNAGTISMPPPTPRKPDSSPAIVPMTTRRPRPVRSSWSAGCTSGSEPVPVRYAVKPIESGGEHHLHVPLARDRVRRERADRGERHARGAGAPARRRGRSVPRAS